MVACEVMQEDLVKQQQALQDQLQKALQLHLTPKTSVDTATVADKVISMFDDMIQVLAEPFSAGSCDHLRLVALLNPYIIKEWHVRYDATLWKMRLLHEPWFVRTTHHAAFVGSVTVCQDVILSCRL